MGVRHPYRCGDLVLVPLPYTGPSGEKTRPALVLSTDSYHEEWDEILVASLTSKAPRRMRPTDCPVRDWQQAGLHQASWMRSHLVTVDRRRILMRMGALTACDLAAVEACLRLATDLESLTKRGQTGSVEHPAAAPRERGPFVVVASLHRPLEGCIAKQRCCHATVATVATMQRSWDRQGQTPTCSAIVATVASLHRCMQRCNDRSLHATMQRSGGQTMTTWPGSKPSRPGPGPGFSTKPVWPPKAKGSDPFLLETLMN
jgi:mRNA interferase MazF